MPIQTIDPETKALFDAIMGPIEPELTTSVFPTLEEKYMNETPDQKVERLKRYKNAVNLFLEEYERFTQFEHAQMLLQREDVMEIAKRMTSSKAAGQIDNLKSTIGNS